MGRNRVTQKIQVVDFKDMWMKPGSREAIFAKRS